VWTIPIISSFPWIGHWIVKLITHTEKYGAGRPGLLPPAYPWNWQCIIFDVCSPLTLFAFPALLLNLWEIIRNRASKASVFFLATAFCILVQFALIAKHCDEHYLVSVMNLFGPLFVLFYLNVKNKNLFFKTIVSLCIIIFMAQSLRHVLDYNKQLSGYTKEAVRFNNMIHTKYPDFIFLGVFPMPMLTHEAAFFWGNDRDSGQQDELSTLYPKNLAYFFDNANDYAPYTSGIYSIKQRVWADDLIASGSRVLFVVPKGYDFSRTPYTVIPVEQGEHAAACLLVKSTEKQANDFFETSVKLLEAGDYPRAFAFALKSKELHYQPEGKIDFLLSLFYSHMKH
jgi:hypothetical protein